MARFTRGRHISEWKEEPLSWDLRTRELLLSFSIKNKKPTDGQKEKILALFDENGIRKGSMVFVEQFSKWIIGDCSNEEFLTQKFKEGTSESEGLIIEIDNKTPVMFLGVSINKIVNNINDRSPIFKKGRRRRKNKNSEYCFMVNVLTSGGRIACFLLPFYDVDSDVPRDMIKNMFVLATTSS